MGKHSPSTSVAFFFHPPGDTICWPEGGDFTGYSSLRASLTTSSHSTFFIACAQTKLSAG